MRIGRIQNNRSVESFDGVAAQRLEFIEYCCNNEAESDALCAAKEEVLI